MCQQVRCRTCGKPTWAGCGNHIEAALADVPRDQRCKCRETAAASGGEEKKPKRLFGLF